MRFFKNIFKKEEPLVPFSLSALQVDIHSHLIPGIDDGSKTMEETLKLAKGLVSLGYRKAITTPHVMSDYYKNTPEIILSGLQELRSALAKEKIPLDIEAAAEYYCDFEFMEKIKSNNILSFGDNYVLIECSFVDPPLQFDEAIFQLQTHGYKPILAHPERYPYWHRKTAQFDSFRDKDLLLQVNLLSLMGRYGPEVKAMGEWLIENDRIAWLGTDLHNEMHLEELANLKLKASLVEKIQQTSFLNTTL